MKPQWAWPWCIATTTTTKSGFPHRRRERKLQCNDELSYQVLLPPGYLRNYSQDEGRRLILTYSVHRAKFPLPSSRIIFLSFATPRSDGMLIIVFNSLLSLLIWLLSFLLSKRIFVPTMWFTVLNENASVAWLYSNIHIIVGNEKQETNKQKKKHDHHGYCIAMKLAWTCILCFDMIT